MWLYTAQKEVSLLPETQHSNLNSTFATMKLFSCTETALKDMGFMKFLEEGNAHKRKAVRQSLEHHILAPISNMVLHNKADSQINQQGKRTDLHKHHHHNTVPGNCDFKKGQENETIPQILTRERNIRQ